MINKEKQWREGMNKTIKIFFSKHFAICHFYDVRNGTTLIFFLILTLNEAYFPSH